MLLFWASFLVTLALLAGTAWTGRRGRRVAHYVLATTSIVMLAVTVVLTERLLRAVEFPERELGIHLTFAKTAAALVVPVVITGLLTIRWRRWKRVHLATVATFFVVTLTATGTGIWVFSLSATR